MNSLLAIEWLKIKRYRTFWVLMVLFAVLLPIWNFEIANGFIKVGGGNINVLSQAYSFPDVWANMGFWGSIFITFLSILIIILTANEYTFRTNRQMVIDGWTKTAFFNAKILMIVVLSFVATAYLFLLGLVFGFVNSGSLAGWSDHIEQVWYFFLLSLDYMGFALFLALWIRRSGMAISLFLLYDLIIENVIRFMVNTKFETHIANLLPLQSSDELLPLPLWKTMATMIHNDNYSAGVYVLATIFWCLIYYFAGRTMLLRRDW